MAIHWPIRTDTRLTDHPWEDALNNTRIAAALLIALGGLTACGLIPTLSRPTPVPPTLTQVPTVAPTAVVPTVPPVTANATKSATLRVTLERLLSEHVILTASATGAAFDGRDADFKAAADALDANSVDLSSVVGSVYGDAAEKQFLSLWRRHIGLFVDYASTLIVKDKTKQDRVANDLLGYSDEFGNFLNAANPNLPKDVAADLVKTHIQTVKDVIDAQAAKDSRQVYPTIRKAFAHMDLIANPLAGAIAKQFPEKFDGNPGASASTLRTSLTMLLTEHVYLVSAVAGATLRGNKAEFNAAAEQLNGNSMDLSRAIGSVYGSDVERVFAPLWAKHIGFFVDYTTGLANKDKAKQDKAVSDLLGYPSEFGNYFTTVTNKALPADAVSDVAKDHLLTLKDVIDAQAAKDYGKQYAALRKAFVHMSTIADPLADAFVNQFPDKFK